MKRILISALFVFIFAGCNRQGSDLDQKVITVSIEPIRFFTSVIAGDSYSINVIVPPGASPATYEPPPEVIRGIRNSDLIIINGYLGFEMAWIDRMLGLNEEAEVLRLADSQDLIATESHRHNDITHYTGVDPHFWLSPQRARIIARDIKDFLVQNDPDLKETYITNYLKIDSIIQDTDSYIRSLLNASGTKSFMIFHPSLTYFALDYGLEQIPVETEGKEPSPSELKDLIDRGREENLKMIFIQREFDTKNARLIGEEIGAETVVINPLSDNWVSSVKEIAENLAR